MKAIPGNQVESTFPLIQHKRRRKAVIMIAEWDSSYSLGVDKIDEQHKTLFSIINKLYDGILRQQEKETLDQVLDEMISYTSEHFRTEEELMLAIKFPSFESHQSEHQGMTEKLKVFQLQYHEGKQNLGVEVLNELIDWLHQHLGETDAKIRPFLEQNGKR